MCKKKYILFLLSYIFQLSAGDNIPPEWVPQSVNILKRIRDTPNQAHTVDKSKKYPYFFAHKFPQILEHKGLPIATDLEKRRSILNASMRILQTDQHLPSDPTKTHWHLVWITNPKEPKSIPDSYIDTLTQNILKHQKAYTFHMWSNVDLQKEMDMFAEKKASVQYHHIDYIVKDMSKPVWGLLQRCIDERYFVLACDILRFNLVHFFAKDDSETYNFYTDLGLEFHVFLDPGILRQATQMTSLMEHGSKSLDFIDINSCVLGGSPENSLTTLFLRDLETTIKGLNVHEYMAMTELSDPYPPFATMPAVLLALGQLSDTDIEHTLWLPCTNTKLVKWHHMGSWSNGKSGNKSVKHKPLTASTFFGQDMPLTPPDWPPTFQATSWIHMTKALQSFEASRILEVGGWTGEETLNMLHLVKQGDPVDVIWHQPAYPGFPIVQGAYHRFLHTIREPYEERRVIIHKEHPNPYLKDCAKNVEGRAKKTYHFIDMKFLFTKGEGYLETLHNAWRLLEQGGTLRTPTTDTWRAMNCLNLAVIPNAFLRANKETTCVTEQDGYLYIKKR